MNHHVVKEPPWLQAAVDQRMALMKEHLSSTQAFEITGTNVLIMSLTEPSENATRLQSQMWEKMCDNCSRFKVDGLNIGHVERMWGEYPVVIYFGVCDRCPLDDA